MSCKLLITDIDVLSMKIADSRKIQKKTRVSKELRKAINLDLVIIVSTLKS
jgi:hypothetical protein